MVVRIVEEQVMVLIFAEMFAKQAHDVIDECDGFLFRDPYGKFPGKFSSTTKLQKSRKGLLV
jgi:hypothetical protein